MSLLTLSDVTVEFGGTTLFEKVGFRVSAGDRWGIVGRNGTGKTTLFNIIAGTQQPTRGTVVRSSGLRIATLDQYRDFGDAETVWDAAASGYQHLLDLEHSLRLRELRLSEAGSDVTPKDLEEYGVEQERFQDGGGYEFRARIDAVLQGIGFDPEDARTRGIEGLSGGERGRVGLAAQLAAPVDLLLLDEPTNHLDLETIEWLKRFLSELGTALMVISHDRAFLDDGVDRILHFSAGTTTEYRGGYSAFATQRAERAEALSRQVAQQEKVIAKEEDYIRRHIAGQNSAQAKGRRTRLGRLPRLTPLPSEDDAMALRFDVRERGGDQVAIFDEVRVEIEGRVLVEGFSGIARRGDIVALVGSNGSGKTTLLSALLGKRPVEAGDARLGSSISVEWFRQDLSQIPVGRRIYDCVADLRPAWDRGKVQGHLGRFGFSGDDVQKNTSNLSGGERARVALALMTLNGVNLLVLDEPTNHLDVESIEALEDALEAYDGTVILVSHDRALLRELSTRVWAFQGTKIVDFLGPFVDWEVREAERRTQTESDMREAQTARARESKQSRNSRVGEDREVRRERGRLKRVSEEREKRVHELEGEVTRLEEALANEDLYDGSAEGAVEAARINRQLQSVREKLEQAFTEWAEADEAVAAFS